MGVMDKFLNYMKLNEDDEEYDTDDDYIDEEDDEYVEPAGKKAYKEPEEDKQARKPLAKVTPLPKASAKRMQNSSGMEVCVFKPASVEDAREITETLLANRTVVLNLEGLDVDIAQRIIDFTSGSCYAMSGHIEKISNFIFIIAPQSIEISGDFEEIISSGIRIPSFSDSSF